MAHDEKKATEDLLAGFDRPGRSPRAPRVQSKFVDFAPPVDARRGNETALVTRARRLRWLPWIAVGLVLTLTIVAIAWIVRREPTAKPAPPAPAIAPVTAEAPPPVTPSVILPSPPPTPPPAVAAPSAVQSSAPRPSATPHEDPRVDFVRNL